VAGRAGRAASVAWCVREAQRSGVRGGEERAGGKVRRGRGAVSRPWCSTADRVSVRPGVSSSMACVAGAEELSVCR
jgi:hypothetical protein